MCVHTVFYYRNMCKLHFYKGSPHCDPHPFASRDPKSPSPLLHTRQNKKCKKKTFSSKRVWTPIFGFEGNALTIWATTRVHDWCCVYATKLQEDLSIQMHVGFQQLVRKLLIFFLSRVPKLWPQPLRPPRHPKSLIFMQPPFLAHLGAVGTVCQVPVRSVLSAKIAIERIFFFFVGGLRPPNPPFGEVTVSETSSNP